MQGEQRARTIFLTLWTLITAVKLVIAARLPLFVDEAFYWQEGQHLAAAYSDLPGLTAWLTRLGVELGGQHVLARAGPGMRNAGDEQHAERHCRSTVRRLLDNRRPAPGKLARCLGAG